MSSMGVGRENARQAEWEVLKPSTSPCGADGADPEHPNPLGRAQVLRPSVPRGALRDRVGVLWPFTHSQSPGAVRQKCRSYVLELWLFSFKPP